MKIKSLIAGICVGTLAFGSLAFAEENVSLISENSEKGIYIDNNKIDAAYLETSDKGIMIPVRKVCESMGFNIEWNSDTNNVVVEKMPMYFTFNVYEDGYTLSKTAPILLGTAPIVENCTTYVPISFVSDIMSCEVSVDGDKIDIKTPVEEKKTNTVIFNGITDNMCVVYDIVLGDVLVNISDNTIVTGDVNTFEKGQVLEIVYDDFMTMSLPPITNALEITCLDGEMAELIEGTVSEIITEEGINQIVIDDKEGIKTALNIIADKTVLMAVDGTEIEITDFEKGAKVTAVASNAATRSLPPQRAAYAVRITE